MHSVLEPRQMWSLVPILAVTLKMPAPFPRGHSSFLQPDWYQQRQLRWLSDSPCNWDVAQTQYSAFSIGAPLTSLPVCLILSEAWGWCYPRSHQHLTLPARCHPCPPGCCLECWSTSSRFCFLWLSPGAFLRILTNFPLRLALSWGRVWPSMADWVQSLRPLW